MFVELDAGSLYKLDVGVESAPNPLEDVCEYARTGVGCCRGRAEVDGVPVTPEDILNEGIGSSAGDVWFSRCIETSLPPWASATSPRAAKNCS